MEGMNKQTLHTSIIVGLFLIPFIPFLASSVFFFPFITTKAFAFRIIVEIVFALWLLLALSDKEYRPKRSNLLYAVFIFLGVIGLADIFGVDPIRSFWSNFERMEGYITLFHLGMLFMVMGSVFKEIEWKRWWNASLGASFLMVLFCLLQIIGLKTINQGGVRVDGTLGNAIYLAVYMLFHIFVACLFLFREWKNVTLRWVYGLLILLQVFVLYYTATRGAMLGLIGGFLIVALLNVRNREEKYIRKVSIAFLSLLVILVGSFFLLRNTSFVQNSPVLSRFASLSPSELKTQGRYFVWPMAIEGVKENPILGWGQENFPYVFQEHYKAEMFRLEPWFDRAHNIFLDWLVSGGVLGLLSYLSLYCAALYLLWKGNFSHLEKSILTGLIGAYFFHNFFVFDHLVSYVLFFSLLAYIHSRNGSELLWQKSISEDKAKKILLPALSIILVLVLYFVNVRPIMTNSFLIEALKSIQTPSGMSSAIKYFKKAYGVSTLGKSEAVEHMSANSVAILSSDIPMEEKNAFFAFAQNAVLERSTNSDLPKDARYELMAGSFLSNFGLFEESRLHLENARTIMPEKQQIYFEIGSIYISEGKSEEALKLFKQAYDLAPEAPEAKLIYLIGSIYAGDREVEREMRGVLTENEFFFDDRIINAYHSSKRRDTIIEILRKRMELDPENSDKYTQLINSLPY